LIQTPLCGGSRDNQCIHCCANWLKLFIALWLQVYPQKDCLAHLEILFPAAGVVLPWSMQTS